MFCAHCGAQLADEARFCGSCGAEVAKGATDAATQIAPTGAVSVSRASRDVEIVKQLLDYERTKEDLHNQLAQLHADSYPALSPEAPQQKHVERVYPEVKSAIPFNYVLAFVPVGIAAAISIIVTFSDLDLFFVDLLCGLVMLWPVVYYFAILRKERAEDVERILASDEYRAQCQSLDRQYDVQQAQFNREYADSQELYETTLAQYNAGLADWTRENEGKIAQAEAELVQVSEQLSSLYEKSRLIPAQYRNLEAVGQIYTTISSSGQDLAAAIVSYEAMLQRRSTDQIAAAQWEANAIADQARKDQNIANAVLAFEQNGIRNELKERNEMLKNARKKRR